MNSRSAPPRPSRRFRVLASIVLTMRWLLRWRVQIAGTKNLPKTGGAVITWNHHSHVDFVFAAWGPYRARNRPVRILAKASLWSSRWTRWIATFADAVPVERTAASSRRQAFGSATDALASGDLVLVAPEGTISRSLELMRFSTGAVRMAQQAGVPVVPSAGWGSHRLVSYGTKPSLRRAYKLPILVAYGEPIWIGPDEDIRQANDRVRVATQTLLTALQAAYPDGAPSGAWWVPARLGGSAPPSDTVMRQYRRDLSDD